MCARLSILALLALLSVAASPAAGASAVVTVAEDGGFPPDTVKTVRSLAVSELRTLGVDVQETPGARDREFVIRQGRLDQKVLVTLEDVEPPRTTPEFSATHAASSINEADVVVPRLVRAVLKREPFDKGARMPTVTARESAAFRSRPGEGLFVFGVGLAPLGASIGWSYEARAFRIGILAQGADDGASFFGVEGAWILSDASVSPYLGAGLGSVGGNGDASLGTKLEAGVEAFRLHRVRLMAGVSAIIPFEPRPGQDHQVDLLSIHIRQGKNGRRKLFSPQAFQFGRFPRQWFEFPQAVSQKKDCRNQQKEFPNFAFINSAFHFLASVSLFLVAFALRLPEKNPSPRI